MNTAEMLSLLEWQLEDVDKVKFDSDEMKLDALSNAQVRLAQMLDNRYLTSLGKLDTSLSVTNGRVSLNSLSYPVLSDSEGIVRVKITNGKYARKIDVEDIRKTENPLLGGGVQSPRYYIYQNSIYILPETTANIDVYYLRIPPSFQFNEYLIASGTKSAFVCYDGQGLSTVTDYYKGVVIYCVDKTSYYVVTGYTGSPSTFMVGPDAETAFAVGNKFYFTAQPFDELNLEGITCILNKSLHKLVVKLAESEMWSMDKKPDRSSLALNAVINEINILNARLGKNIGIGTESKR